MNEMPILPDDPRLTAYALGELEGDERTRFEAALRGDPAARAVVEEIRAMAAQLETVLETEGNEFAPGAVISGNEYGSASRRRLWSFPQTYYLIGGLAAACFAVVVALRDSPRTRKPEPKKIYETVLIPMDMGLKEGEVAAEAKSVAPATELIPINAPISGMGAAPDFDFTASGLLEQSKQLTKLSALDESLAWAPPPVLSFDFGNAQRRAAELRRVQENVARSRQGTAAMAFVRRVVGSGRSDAAEERLVAVNAEPIVLSAFNVQAAPEFGYGGSATPAGWHAEKTRNTESYAFLRESDFRSARQHPLSTFSADVDTASYANVRRMLAMGERPPVDAVRIEEMLNYFPFPYAAPKKNEPFAATMEVAEAPWAEGHQLVRIGLKGREVALAERGAANLVFLLDVSGSMNAANKLPLVKESMRLLLGRLRADDRVAIVTYAGASGLALPSTPAANQNEILAALAELAAGGSTHGSRGIELAYDIAKANFVSGGINRVILCTDGDFNVGVTHEGGLVRLIEEKAKSGVFLTVLGFGMGNLKDSMMQQLADRGNGNYGYVDTRREAEKLLVEQVSGTLVTIAKDVKLQVEFNPAKVASYRLIGYEKRVLNNEDFANDKVDAGELGAGHTVTALYEIVPVDAAEAQREEPEEDRRYVHLAGAPTGRVRSEFANELLTLKIRYKEPTGFLSQKLEYPLVDSRTRFVDASEDFKFAAAVAGFGMILKNSEHRGTATLADVTNWAEAGAARDPGGYRAEFISMVQQARSLL